MDMLSHLLIAGHHHRSHSSYRYKSELAKALMIAGALLIAGVSAVGKKNGKAEKKTALMVILICIGFGLMAASVVVEVKSQKK